MSQNPQGAAGADVTRRDFLKGGVVAGAVAGGSLGAFYFGYGAAMADPLRVGVIGTGDEGSVLIGAINPRFLAPSTAIGRATPRWPRAPA